MAVGRPKHAARAPCSRLFAKKRHFTGAFSEEGAWKGEGAFVPKSVKLAGDAGTVFETLAGAGDERLQVDLRILLCGAGWVR